MKKTLESGWNERRILAISILHNLDVNYSADGFIRMLEESNRNSS